MKAIVVALVLLGFAAGCARHEAVSPSAAPADRPDLTYKSASDCTKAGRTWNATSGVCM
jgi:hypothetical protein